MASLFSLVFYALLALPICEYRKGWALAMQTNGLFVMGKCFKDKKFFNSDTGSKFVKFSTSVTDALAKKLECLLPFLIMLFWSDLILKSVTKKVLYY